MKNYNIDREDKYNLDSIDSKNALINIILGGRTDGKSFQVKHKKGIIPYLESMVRTAYEDRDRFILVRRLREELTSEKIEGYFKDVDVKKLTNGEYDTISYYRREIYFANYVDFKKVNGEKIGYVVPLSGEQNYAGVSFLDVKNIIMEEFMTRTVYLANEPDKLINLWNTVDRGRGIVRMWLVGNSISKICPYLNDWGLQPIIRKQKQGEISEILLPTGTFDDKGNEIHIKCAIEYSKHYGGSNFSIGKHKDMLNKGTWQSDPQPHLPKSIKEYKHVFKIGFMYKEFKFLAELLKDNDTKDYVWFIYPYNKEFKKDLFIFSDVVKLGKQYQRNIYDLSFKNEKLQNILNTFREGNIFYSSDLCGTDFKQCIDFTIRK